MNDSTRQLLDEIGQYRLLAPEEEIRLARKVQAYMEVKDSTDPKHRRIIRDGKRAQERMVTANLRLVVFAAKKYTARCHSMELSDLVSEGAIGLLRAVEKFDPSRGYKFSTYAYWWIKQAFTRAITNTDKMVRVPVHQDEALTRIYRARQELGPRASEEAIRLKAGVSERDWRVLMHAPLSVGSLDIPIPKSRGNGGAELTILDTIVYEQQPYVYENADRVEAWLHALPDERQRDVIRKRYGIDHEPHSLARIAEQYGITRERIRQIQLQAERRLRLLLAQTEAA